MGPRNWRQKAAIGFFIALAVLGISLAFALSASAAPTAAGVSNGGTGTSTKPIYGQLLIGGINGEYEFTSTSSLIAAGSVASIFGRSGVVTAQNGDYTTSLVPEGSNLYWTQLRFDNALTATTSLPKITTLSSLALPYSQLTSIRNLFSTTSEDYWLTQRQGAAFSTTSADWWVSLKGYITGISWGSITGTLSNQADLNGKFSTKVGTSSALSANQLVYATGFNTTASVATSSGTVSSPLTGSFVCIGSGCSVGIQNASASQGGAITLNDYQRLYTATSTFAWPFIYTTSTNTVTWGGIATSALPTIGNLAYWTAANTLGTVATTSATCSGSVSCTGFNVLGASPITITGATPGDPFYHPVALSSATTTLVSFYGNASSTMLTATSTVWLTNYTTALLSTDSTGKVTSISPTRAGDLPYYNGSIWTSLAGNNSGTQCLQETSAGVPSWVACGAGGGGSSGGGWTFIKAGIYNSTTTDQVMIGETSTTTLAKLEINGGLFASASSTITGPFTALNASTTNLTVPSGGTMWFPGITSKELATDVNGKVYGAATTTAGTGLSFSAGAFNVNSSQSIATLSNLTNNGFVQSSGGIGTLGVQQYPCTLAQGCTNATSIGTDKLLYTNHAGDTVLGAASSTIFGTGTGGQILGWANGQPSWVGTSTPNTGLFYATSTNTFGCNTAGSAQFGCLTSTDWTTFNNKQATLSFSTPLILNGARR
jgi:hypothetical protein